MIELLVVISIIAVLIALLLPALGSAREAAQAVRCASQLRQVALVTHMYADENDNLLFPREARAYPQEEGESTSWWVPKILEAGWLPSANNRTSDVLRCPSWEPSSAEADSDIPILGTRWPRAYGIRSWVAPGDESPWGGGAGRLYQYRDRDSVRRPSDFWIYGDSIRSTDSGAHAWLQIWYVAIGNPDLSVHGRHGRVANLAFLDGHVARQGREYIETLHEEQNQGVYSDGHEYSFYTDGN